MLSTFTLAVVGLCVTLVQSEGSELYSYSHLTQPHELLYGVQSQVNSLNKLREADHFVLDDITAVLTRISRSPKDVLGYAQSGNAQYSVSDRCGNQTLHMLESIAGIIHDNQTWIGTSKCSLC